MRCPHCDKGTTTVVRSWEAGGRVRRLRECPACGQQLATLEQVDAAEPAVVKRDGRREGYSRAKLARSVGLACAKRGLPPEAVDDAIRRVEARLREGAGAEVSSEQIAELALAELRLLDEVAYLRFASYVRPIASAAAFAEEAAALREWRRRSVEGKLQLALDFEADQPHWE